MRKFNSLWSCVCGKSVCITFMDGKLRERKEEEHLGKFKKEKYLNILFILKGRITNNFINNLTRDSPIVYAPKL